MTASEKKELMTAACRVRMDIIRAVHAAKSGHPGGSLSRRPTCSPICTRGSCGWTPRTPSGLTGTASFWSKGHTAPGLYAVLAERGFFPVEELETLRHIGSDLQGHPNMNETPGVDMSTGSLGQGISAACGMALSRQVPGQGLPGVRPAGGRGDPGGGGVGGLHVRPPTTSWTTCGAVIDNNGLQIDGNIADVMSPYPIPDKLRGLRLGGGRDRRPRLRPDGGRLCPGQGHKGRPLRHRHENGEGQGSQPLWRTRAGWHGKAPNDQEYETAMAELSARWQKWRRCEMAGREKDRHRDSYGAALVELGTGARGRHCL